MVGAVGSFGGLRLRLIQLEAVPHVDALHDQHTVFDFHITTDFTGEPVITGGDPARLQRASKGSR